MILWSRTYEFAEPDDAKRLDEQALGDLIGRFTSTPSEGSRARHEALREFALAFATYIAENTPPGREQSLALTKLQECTFWAYAANERRGEG